MHPSLLPHCPQIFPRNMPASRKSSGTGKKHSLPEAPPVPSDVAAPFSWGSAARRQPLNPATPPWSRAEPVLEVYLYKGWRRCRRPPGPVHHRTSVSPRAPPGPHPETAPKFTCAPTANPHGTEVEAFLGSPRTPQMCIMSTGRFEN